MWINDCGRSDIVPWLYVDHRNALRLTGANVSGLLCAVTKPSASASWTLNVFVALTKGGSKQAREKKRRKLAQNKCTTHHHSQKLNYYCVLSIHCRIIFSSHATHLHFWSWWLRNVWLGYSSAKEMRRFVVVLVLSMRSPDGIHNNSMPGQAIWETMKRLTKQQMDGWTWMRYFDGLEKKPTTCWNAAHHMEKWQGGIE